MDKTLSIVAEGVKLYQAGNLADADERLRRLLKRRPNQETALYLRGLIARDSGNLDAAFTFMNRAFSKGLTDPAAKFQFAHVLLSKNKPDRAASILKSALLDKPDFEQALLLLGNLYFEMENYKAAEKTYKSLIGIDVNNWQSQMNLAMSMYRQSNYHEALEHLRFAQTLAPDNVDILTSQASVQLRLGDNIGAQQSIDTATKINPTNSKVRLIRARLLLSDERVTDALNLLHDVQSASCSKRTFAEILYERVKAFEKMERFQDAYQSMLACKGIFGEIRKIQYDPALAYQNLGRVEDSLSNLPKLASSAGSNLIRDECPAPIFILGFYRTGSSLLEQILSAHTNVQACGEQSGIQKITQELDRSAPGSYLKYLAQQKDTKLNNILENLRRSYLKSIKQEHDWTTETRWFVDKQPFNVLYLPMIKILFPNSPIIHLRRHPYDTVISCFFQLFQERSEWSYSLADITTFYSRCHEHAENVEEYMDTNKYFNIKYEALIEDPEKTVRMLLSEFELPWEPDCMQYYKNNKIVNTASWEQVKKPIYSTAVNRYKHYLGEFDETSRSILNPIVSKLKYDLT